MPASPSSPGSLATECEATHLGTNRALAADLISTVITAEYDGEGLIA